MRQPVVVVTFFCQSGETEKLALSAAVGAVQARAMIRLRRLPDPDVPQINEELARMRKEYVPPAEGDLVGADALILVSSPQSTPSTAPWKDFLDLLGSLRDKLRGKVGAAIGGIGPIMTGLGLTTIPEAPIDPLLLGRAIGEAARNSRR